MTPQVILKNDRPRLSSAESGHIPARMNERDFREEKAQVLAISTRLSQRSLRKALHFDYLSAQRTHVVIFFTAFAPRDGFK